MSTDRPYEPAARVGTPLVARFLKLPRENEMYSAESG